MLEEHNILDRRVLHQQGCFSLERIWISGWHNVPDASARFIWGWTGKETEITKTVIRPIRTFEVKNGHRAPNLPELPPQKVNS